MDPYQTPRSVTSDMGLHCLSMSLLWDARLIWVKHEQVEKWRPIFFRYIEELKCPIIVGNYSTYPKHSESYL